jgi:hypothetical protein
MSEHTSISPAEQGWTVANDNETCLVIALNCNVLQQLCLNPVPALLQVANCPCSVLCGDAWRTPLSRRRIPNYFFSLQHYNWLAPAGILDGWVRIVY